MRALPAARGSSATVTTPSSDPPASGKVSNMKTGPSGRSTTTASPLRPPLLPDTSPMRGPIDANASMTESFTVGVRWTLAEAGGLDILRSFRIALKVTASRALNCGLPVQIWRVTKEGTAEVPQ